jgi:hypothetical protein
VLQTIFVLTSREISNRRSLADEGWPVDDVGRFG